MKVSIAEAKNKLTQLITAVERGETVTVCRHGHPVVDIVRSHAVRRPPTFGTLKGILHMTPEQFQEAVRPMSDDEVDAFLEGR